MYILRTCWHYLLQLDTPVPQRTDAEIAAEVERNYRWNFGANLLDVVTFWFGLNFAAPSTVIPLFLSKLTLNPFIIGLAAMISQAGWYLPQLFTSTYTERLARKKPVVVRLGFFMERLPVWFWPLAALFALHSPFIALALFLLALACHSLGAGMIAPAWQDMIARCFPVTRRGRFFGISTFLGSGGGALGALVSSWLLKTYAFPSNFVATFSVAALFITISWGFLALTREPVQPVPLPASSASHGWVKWTGILREDHNFRRYLQARFVMGLGTMGIGFMTISAVQRWQINDEIVGFFTIALLIGQSLGNLSAGVVADRFGHKLPLEMGTAVLVLAFMLARLAPSSDFYYAVFAMIGFAIGMVLVSGIMISLEFSPPQFRPTYIGIANTIAGIGGGIAPLLGGWIAGKSYHWLFVLSAGCGAIGFMLLHWSVKEPRFVERERPVNRSQ